MGCLTSCGPFLCFFRCCSVGSLSLGGFFMLLVCGGYWFVCTQEWLPFGICFFTQLLLVIGRALVRGKGYGLGWGVFCEENERRSASFCTAQTNSENRAQIQ